MAKVTITLEDVEGGVQFRMNVDPPIKGEFATKEEQTPAMDQAALMVNLVHAALGLEAPCPPVKD